MQLSHVSLTLRPDLLFIRYHNDFFNCKNVDQKEIEAGVNEEAKKLDRYASRFDRAIVLQKKQHRTNDQHLNARAFLRWKDISDKFATQINAEKLKDKQWEDVQRM